MFRSRIVSVVAEYGETVVVIPVGEGERKSVVYNICPQIVKKLI
jgi:hypothetical protein